MPEYFCPIYQLIKTSSLFSIQKKTFFSISCSRMHCIYGALRLFALVFDAFVFYHAKDLKIIEEDSEEESENNSNDEVKKDSEPNEKTAESPKIKHHPLVIEPEDKSEPPHKPKHKRSASREIRLLFDNNEEEGSHGKDRRSSHHSHHSDYVAGEIASITSNGVI